MSLKQSDLIEVRKIAGKGRGVVARCDIPEETVIERAPVLVMPEEDVEDAKIADYVYAWGRGTVALALGYGSLYNHSYRPNARYDDIGVQTKVFTTIKPVRAGEEITINYNGDPDNPAAVGFDVQEAS